jgi:hypothetical protein
VRRVDEVWWSLGGEDNRSELRKEERQRYVDVRKGWGEKTAENREGGEKKTHFVRNRLDQVPPPFRKLRLRSSSTELRDPLSE